MAKRDRLGGWPVNPVDGRPVGQIFDRFTGQVVDWDGVFCRRCGCEPCRCPDDDTPVEDRCVVCEYDPCRCEELGFEQHEVVLSNGEDS